MVDCFSLLLQSRPQSHEIVIVDERESSRMRRRLTAVWDESHGTVLLKKSNDIASFQALEYHYYLGYLW